MGDKKNANPVAKFVAPDWVNAALIQKALHNAGEKNLQVKQLSVRPATAPGDNYASVIYRTTAALSDGSERSFLVKGPPPGEGMAEMTKELGTFKREATMLAEVVPLIEALLDEASPRKFPPLAARCPLHGSESPEFLVLEDLAPAGFKLADRKQGLDFRHSLLAVRTLARYHAGSHALLRQQPEIADKLPNPFDKPHPAVSMFIELGIQAAADACRKWSGFKEYANLLDKYKPVAVSRAMKIGEVKPGEFNVLMHGDFWVNNMMFRYEGDDPKPRGIRMVDFQGSVMTSPALDLLYFLSTSINDHVSENNHDILVHEYYMALKQTLLLLGLEAPSFEALLADINARGAYALIGSLNVIPIVRAQQPANLDAAMRGDPSSLTSLYDDPAVRKWMRRVLPEYKRRGWLPR